MAFQLRHPLFSIAFKPTKHVAGEEGFFTVDEKGEFPVLFAGHLNKSGAATFLYRVRVGSVGGPDATDSADGRPRPGSRPLHGGFETVQKRIPLTLQIFTPDGREFTGEEVTLADLQRHRDQRGVPTGPWSYKVTGESEHVVIDEDSKIIDAHGSAGLSLTETVQNESAPPLVPDTPVTPIRQSFQFDLFRVGTFVAEISRTPFGSQWRGTMRLIDPNGTVVGSTPGRTLSVPIDLATIDRSRDAAGGVRKWTLEVSAQGGSVVGTPHVSATVIAKGRIAISTLQSRIDALLGPHGSFIKLFGQNSGGDALARLVITDPISAETIDMHGLLDDVLSKVRQDGGADPGNIQANTVYTLARKSESLKAGTSLHVGTLKVDSIDVAIGPGVLLGPSVPAIRFTVAVSGEAIVNFGPARLADASVRNGRFSFEVGMKLDPDGIPRVVSAVTDSPFDISISATVKAALLATLGIAGLIGGLSVTDYVESEVNEAIAAGARNLFSDPTLGPRILMTIFGAHFTYRPFRVEGDELVFDHVAPIEPEPKPTPGYQGAIGRSFTQVTTDSVTFLPPVLGDTWRADNLAAKIDHIVVVMMENRSYDHVLGYRAQAPIGDGADGLTPELIAAIAAAENGPFTVRRLRDAGFPKNDVGLMTRLPKGCGHSVRDVEQQLGLRTTGPGGRAVNSPKGFVDDFTPRLGSDPNGVVPDDVLGFYDQLDLPFFGYLAEHYAYCDHYYCSHPGPTLPNRMYSLTGDLQHDRFGFPLLDNNNRDNFLLSRETTIYDLLARKGLGFRIYESFPSVTMLRMFARYATDDVNIVRFDQLEADLAPGGRGLPAFTAIEPQMHAAPEDDDHPDADMYRGQLFLKRVYDALTSNRALWERTLLIITYDEHGGLYDHVVPPVADVYNASNGTVVGATIAGTATSGAGAITPVRATLATARTVGARAIAGTAIRTGVHLATAGAAPAATREVLAVPYGVRVPTFVVSPWTTPGKGPGITLDHCSILKTVLARFLREQKPFLSDRVHASHTFDEFLTGAAPRLDVPPSPTLPPLSPENRPTPSTTTRIDTPPLSRQEMREGPVDYHALSGRWARQLGR